MEDTGSQTPLQESVSNEVFIAPSVQELVILSGHSYTHHSSIPHALAQDLSTECVLGVDEAGRGPVLGPMVYGLLYLPATKHQSLLAETHHFDDSKVLTPTIRSSLMQKLCTSNTDLYSNCGWATRVMSARDISAGMLKPTGAYNLNAQAMDATIEMIKEIFARGVNVRNIYIDTIGSPAVYQKKLERIFPTVSITVAKKADSLYPCVSAASVCAKVTRDAVLEMCYKAYSSAHTSDQELSSPVEGWGSGYPADARCTAWLKANMNPVFGWGSECRYSWGTAKDLLEAKTNGTEVEWPADGEDQAAQVIDFFSAPDDQSELRGWFGKPVTEEVF